MVDWREGENGVHSMEYAGFVSEIRRVKGRGWDWSVRSLAFPDARAEGNGRTLASAKKAATVALFG